MKKTAPGFAPLWSGKEIGRSPGSPVISGHVSPDINQWTSLRDGHPPLKPIEVASLVKESLR